MSNNFIKVARYKIKLQKKKIRDLINMLRKGDTLLFTVASKKISRNKSNQKGERTQQLKLQISEEKNGSRH